MLLDADRSVIHMLNVLLVVGAVFCALRAIQAKRLLAAAVWLAAVSALIAIVLYQMGAHEVAVVELSVGAGLVTVLFVFAIGVTGEEVMDARTIVPLEVVGREVIPAVAEF